MLLANDEHARPVPHSTGESLAAGLTISSLEVESFRNYEHVRIPNLGALNIFIGKNASGKTSLLEAIQLMTACKSFRTTQMTDVVKWGSQCARITCIVEGNGRRLEEKMHVEDGKRRYSLNENPRSIETMRGILPAVVFCPDDLDLVKGPNSARLNVVDDIAVQMSQSFRSVKRDYTRIVRQKNQALKDEVGDDYLDSIDRVLLKVSAQYTAHRQLLIQKLTQHMSERYNMLANGSEAAWLSYCYSWDYKQQDLSFHDFATETSNRMAPREVVAEEMCGALREARAEERARRKSVIGAHADKLFFVLDGQNATKFASQGQQRSLVLAFKLAELDVLTEQSAQQPVLLLDDVMSELDQQRREQFMSFVDDKVQTFITTTNKEYFNPSLLAKANMFEMPFENRLCSPVAQEEPTE